LILCSGFVGAGVSPNGTNAALKIQLRSDGAALVIDASNVTVRGLIINLAQGSGVAIDSGSGSQVEGNFLGTDATGTQDLDNAAGVFISSGASNNTVGGITRGAQRHRLQRQ
jgi:hypothetical protein